MTAGDRENAAAAAAVTLGEQLATEYWQAAGQTPGVGWQVALASVADGQGRPVKGEGYDVAPTAPALTHRRGPDWFRTTVRRRPAAGGAGYHATQPGSVAPFDGVAWPSGRGRLAVIATFAVSADLGILSAIHNVGAHSSSSNHPARRMSAP